MGILNNSSAIPAPAGGGEFYSHQIASSIRNSTAQSGTLKFTAGTPTSSTTFTMSYWVKKYTNSTTGGDNNIFVAGTGSSTSLNHAFATGPEFWSLGQGGNWGSNYLISTAKIRDTSAWYHVVWRYDSTQGTAADRVRLYANGEQVTSWRVSGMHAQVGASEAFSYINESGVVQSFGGISSVGPFPTEGADLQMAEIVFNDGQSYGPDSYGETKNGVWIPKDPSGLTFGNNGYWLKMASGAIGTDSSGNGNTFTVANIATHDVMLDSPTFSAADGNGGNFCTWNPLTPVGGAEALGSLSEGNLLTDSTITDKYSQAIGNMGVRTGKWYLEFYIEAAGYPSWLTGWYSGSQLGDYDGTHITNVANFCSMGYFAGTDIYLTPFGETSTHYTRPAYSGWTSFGAAPTTGDVVMCAMDFDAGKGWWGMNGEWGDSGAGAGNPATGTNPSNTWTVADYADYKFPITLSWADPDAAIMLNAGQDGTFAGNITAGDNVDDTGYGNFKYDVPAEFLSLCSGNLPVDENIDPAQTSDNFPQKLVSTLLYTGDGGTTQAQTGLGFQPDFTWIKQRNGTAGHKLFDSSRGVTKYVASHNNDAETTETDSLKVFGSDGFSVGSNAGTGVSSDTYVAWNWRANGGTTTAGTGDLTSTHQVDPSGGFSIVKAVGDGGSGLKTISHGLSAAPTVIICKNLDAAFNWDTYWSEGFTAGYSIRLNTTNNQLANRWGTINSSIFTVNYNYTWIGTNNFIYYCFTNTEGFIDSGTYVGNGQDDGTFVYTGLKPSFVLLREVAIDNWLVYDDKRGYNGSVGQLYPDAGYSENVADSTRQLDILSNGFKLRTSNATGNASGGTYIYLAFAKNPFKYSLAR